MYLFSMQTAKKVSNIVTDKVRDNVFFIEIITVSSYSLVDHGPFTVVVSLLR